MTIKTTEHSMEIMGSRLREIDRDLEKHDWQPRETISELINIAYAFEAAAERQPDTTVIKDNRRINERLSEISERIDRKLVEMGKRLDSVIAERWEPGSPCVEDSETRFFGAEAPTHYCRICLSRWCKKGDFWNLRSEYFGECCNTATMVRGDLRAYGR